MTVRCPSRFATCALAGLALAAVAPLRADPPPGVLFPVGYHEIKLPAGSEVAGWNTRFWGLGYQVRVRPDTTKAELDKLVSEQLLQQRPTLRTPALQSLSVEGRELRWVFLQDAQAASGQVVEYFILNGSTLFQVLRPAQPGAAGQAQARQDIQALARRLQPRQPQAAPDTLGFCLEGAFLKGQPDGTDVRGKMAVSFRLPAHPDLKICLFLLMNKPKADGTDPDGSPDQGQDHLDENLSADQGTDYFFSWDDPGQPLSLARPRLLLSLEAGSVEKGSVLPKAELQAIWDQLRGSLRLRASCAALATPGGAAFPAGSGLPATRLFPEEQPACPCTQQFVLSNPLGEPLVNRAYTIRDEDGNLLAEGRSDAQGQAQSTASAFPDPVTILVKP